MPSAEVKRENGKEKERKIKLKKKKNKKKINRIYKAADDRVSRLECPLLGWPEVLSGVTERASSYLIQYYHSFSSRSLSYDLSHLLSFFASRTCYTYIYIYQIYVCSRVSRLKCPLLGPSNPIYMSRIFSICSSISISFSLCRYKPNALLVYGSSEVTFLIIIPTNPTGPALGHSLHPVP